RAHEWREALGTDRRARDPRVARSLLHCGELRWLERSQTARTARAPALERLVALERLAFPRAHRQQLSLHPAQPSPLGASERAALTSRTAEVACEHRNRTAATWAATSSTAIDGGICPANGWA